jgi:hypothetical protein
MQGERPMTLHDWTDSQIDSKARTGVRRDRRQFLQQLSAGAIATIGSQLTLPVSQAAQVDAAARHPGAAILPTIKIGAHSLTRLIVGGNPVEGYSHSSHALSQHMREYFTPERTVEFVRRCEQLGINTWQTGHGPSDKVLYTLDALRQNGSRIQWMCLSYESENLKPFKEVLSHKPIAIVHHGGETDKLFRAGKSEAVHDFVKKVHDAGIMAGVSSHNPANIAHVEEKGWENEFFMTCFYQVSRPMDEIRKRLGTGVLDEPFLESDRDEMTAVIQKVKRPCLAFKILAAGRLCGKPESVESAFQYAFSRIKKTDGVIVGMYPKFSDEITTNVQLTLRYGTQT